MCETILQNCIDTEPDYQRIVKKNILCAMKFHKLARNNFNGLTAVVVEDVIGNLIEAIFNFSLIRREECESFPKHPQACEIKFDEVLSRGGFHAVGAKLRDVHLSTLIRRGQDDSLTRK